MSEPEQTCATTPHRDRSARRGTGVIVQIKVKLLGVSKPPVWRRLQLRADTRLDHLHTMIVAAFGWEDYHMHVFTSGPEEFGLPDPELGHTDERRVSLGQLIGGRTLALLVGDIGRAQLGRVEVEAAALRLG